MNQCMSMSYLITFHHSLRSARTHKLVRQACSKNFLPISKVSFIRSFKYEIERHLFSLRCIAVFTNPPLCMILSKRSQPSISEGKTK